MTMGVWTRAVAAFSVVAGAPSVAQAQVTGGSFISLDGTTEHQFSRAGDYLGKVHGAEELSEAGVYRDGQDTSWVNRDDGTKLSGSVLLYIGEVQCCLSVEAISDKYVFQEIWVKGTGFGYRICKNQVFQRRPE